MALHPVRSDARCAIRAGSWQRPIRTARFEPTVFDTSDGVRLHSVAFTGYNPPVTRASDGKLWFLSGEGVSIIDPRHLPFNKLPPPVHVEEVKVDM